MSQDGPKLVPKPNWSKMVPKWSKIVWNQNDPKMVPKLPKNCPKVVPKWSQNSPNILYTGLKVVPKLFKMVQNDPKMVAKWSKMPPK